MKPTEPTLYEAVIARNIKHSNHESDLYLPVNPETTKLVKHYYGDPPSACVDRFRNQVEGGVWYDVAFAYLPWWENKAKKV